MPRLPNGYTQLEYIESSGEQYIDTKISPTQSSKIVLDYLPTEAATGGVFGSRIGVGNAAFALWIVNATSIEDDYASDRDTIQVNDVLTRTLVDKDGNSLNYGTLSHEHAKTTFSNQYPIILFGINSAGTVDNRRVSARLYKCSISNGSVLQREFVPCISPAGNVGLYDVVSKTFYANSGSGAFIPGPEIIQASPTVFAKINGVWKPSSEVYTKQSGKWRV